MFILRIAGEWQGFLEVDLLFGHNFFLLSKKERCLFKLFLCASLAIVFEREFDLHHTVERHVSKCYAIMHGSKWV